MWLRRNDRQAVLPVFGKHYLPEHVPGSGIAIRLRRAFSSSAEHPDSRSLIESSAADSSGSGPMSRKHRSRQAQIVGADPRASLLSITGPEWVGYKSFLTLA